MFALATPTETNAAPFGRRVPVAPIDPRPLAKPDTVAPTVSALARVVAFSEFEARALALMFGAFCEVLKRARAAYVARYGRRYRYSPVVVAIMGAWVLSFVLFFAFANLSRLIRARQARATERETVLQARVKKLAASSQRAADVRTTRSLSA